MATRKQAQPADLDPSTPAPAATLANGWLGLKDTESLLRGRFEPFPVFG